MKKIYKSINIKFFSLVLVFFIMACKEEQSQQQAPPIQEFPVITVENQNVTTFKNYPAIVEGVVNSEIFAKIPGYITQVYVDQGDRVKKGQLLFQLETASLSQDAKAAKARVNLAQVEVNRLKPLVEKNIVSSVQLQSAEANLEDAQSSLESIQANIGYAKISSPVNGVVSRINFRNGALVSPQDAMPLTQVSEIDEVFVYFSMNEKDFLNYIAEAEGKSMEQKIEAFPEVELQLSNGNKFQQKGKIEAISGNVNQNTGTLSFRARFKNPNYILRNGASGIISVPSTYQNRITVPKVSTFERQNRRFVFIVEKDSIYEQAIDVLDETQTEFVLDNQLKPGTKIMGKGVNRVKAGDKIKPKPVSMEEITNSYNTVFK